MNKLWAGITTAAALLTTAGGGATYYALSSSSEAAGASAGPPAGEVASGDPGSVPPLPIPYDGAFDGDSYDGNAAASPAGLGDPQVAGGDQPAGYGYPTVQDGSSTAAWSGSPSQPGVRQVSGEMPQDGYGGAYGGAYGGYGVETTPGGPVSDGGTYSGDTGSGGTGSGGTGSGGAFGGAPYSDAPQDQLADGAGAGGYSIDDHGDATTSDTAADPQDTTAYQDTAAYQDQAAYSTNVGTGQGGAVVGLSDASPDGPAGAEMPSDPTASYGYDDSPAAYGIGDQPATDARRLEEESGSADAVEARVYDPAGGLDGPQGFAGGSLADSNRDATMSAESAEQEVAAGAMAAGAGSAIAGAELLSATPGNRSLDGRQQPSVTIEKRAPAEIQVGRPARFELIVHNVGQTTAHHVVVTDHIPQGTRFVDAVPPPTQGDGELLTWHFDALAPGEDTVISLELMPQSEGEIGSVAHVSFQAQASVRTICTKPELAVEHSVQPKVLIGENAVFEIVISNPGSGAATGVTLEEDVPEGLAHAAGRELEYEIGTLKPGETRRLELILKAATAGPVANRLRVHADGNLSVEDAVDFEVIAPRLQVSLNGPRRRYVRREVTYQIGFSNPGTATAHNIAMSAYLPKGLQFVSTAGKGRYDASTHAVHWQLEQLAPGEEGTVELTALPVEAGDQKLRLDGAADLDLTSRAEMMTSVEGIVELVFTVSDLQDPIEVGTETTYEIRVTNRGTKMATNVQLAAALPPGLTPLDGDGPTAVAVQDQQAVMEPLPRLGPEEEVVYRLRVKGSAEGDHLINVRLASDEITTPVAKQEFTKVYADGR